MLFSRRESILRRFVRVDHCMQNVAHQLWRRNDRHDQPFCMTVCQNVRKLVRRPFFWQSSETETGFCISHFKLCSRKKLLKFRDDQNSPLASIRPKHSEGPTLVPSPPLPFSCHSFSFPVAEKRADDWRMNRVQPPALYNKVSPRWRRDDMPPPMTVRR